jgi:hypothetical protein
MNGERSQLESKAHRSGALLRWLLVLPLTYGIFVMVFYGLRVFGTTGQSLVYDAECEAIYLTPVVFYTAAAVLLVSRRPHRGAWLIVLAGAIATSAYLLVVWFSLPHRLLWDTPVSLPFALCVPLYLTLLAAIEVLQSGRLVSE